jgi:flagellar protein FliS
MMNRGGYKQVQIQTANKGQLIVMLYQGAIRFMKKSLILMDEKDMEGKGNSLIKAQDIILELLYALDQQMLDSGNELALNLQRLYLYGYRQLIQANIRTDPKLIQEVIDLMENLLGAWEQVAAGEGNNTASPPSTRVMLTG